jgi:Helicase conserved C-terminal domain
MVRRLRGTWERPPVVVALTATASERVRRDLCDPLLFDLDPRPVEEGGDVVFHGSNRLELDLIVRVEADAAARGQRIQEDLSPFAREETEGSALVFLPYTGAHGPAHEDGSSSAVEPFTAYLERHLGVRVAMFHGQMGEGLQIEVGSFVRERWQREDRSWGVYLFQGPGGPFCATGQLPEASPGVRYTMVGRWKDSESHGRQFLFDTCVANGTAPAGRSLGDVSGRDRRAEQRAFMHSERRIMVATKSFGMGIDKPDIRLVIHHSPPGDLLSYAQEVGRAARDGNRSRVILYFTETTYAGGRGHGLTDRRIQERFIEGRYVRESDLRACISFLRQCPRWLTLTEPRDGTHRTYVVFSFSEAEAWFSALARDPALAGLPRPYQWPPYRERQKVVQLALEVLFKTVPSSGQGIGCTLLESCQVVATCLRQAVEVDWHGLEDSNADLLREVLDRAGLAQKEFEALCAEAVTGDLLPLARRLGCSVGDTVEFLLEASHLRVVRNLRLGTRGACSLDERNWEVCLSPVLLRDEGLDAVITSVVREHQRRRDEDCRDWDLMLTEYVGCRESGHFPRQCLRRVLLAFLNTGEDVVDEGCGACSGCCPDGDFLPLTERGNRILTIPPELWSRMETIRKATDSLPDIETFRGICTFLGREEGVRWRRAVYLNTERMRREDSGSVGPTALLICFIAHRWLERHEDELHRLFEALWQKGSNLAPDLARLADLVAEVQPGVVPTYWRARTVHVKDTVAGLSCWRALLQLEGLPRSFLHEAASALAVSGDLQAALLVSRTSSTAQEACTAYGMLQAVDLASATFLHDESAAILDTAGSAQLRAETFAGLLLAAHRCGAAGRDLVQILDTAWHRIETALVEETLGLLLQQLARPLAADGRWSGRLLYCLAEEKAAVLQTSVLECCARFLEQGGRFTEGDTGRIASALCRAQRPPRTLFAHVWVWAVDQREAEVVRSLLAMELSGEDTAFRQGLVEKQMARIFHERPTRLHKVIEVIDTLRQVPGSEDSTGAFNPRVQARVESSEPGAPLPGRARRCPIQAAAHVALLEHACSQSKGVEWQASLFRVYVQIGLVRKAVEIGKAFPGIRSVLGIAPRRYLSSHPRPTVAWRLSAWDDALVDDFRRFLQETEAGSLLS